MKKNISNYETFNEKDRLTAIGLFENDPVIMELLVFFHYFAPNIKSTYSDTISSDVSEVIFDELRRIFGEKNRFDYKSNPSDAALAFLCLNTFEIDSTKRQVAFYLAPIDHKDKLTALLRHIRNSISHGHFYIKKLKTYYRIMFEDYSDKKIRARIVLNHSVLKKWMNVIKKMVAEEAKR